MKNNKFVQQGKLTKSGWLSIVAFLLVAVLALSVALGLVVKSGKEKKGTEEAYVGGGMVLPEETEGDGISLTSTVIPKEQYEEYGIMPIAETSYSVTATAKAAGGVELSETQQQFIWSLAWASSNSSDVNTYVSLSAAKGARTATVSLLQPFSTQILLKCTWAYNDTQTGSVTLDYAKRFKGFNIQYASSLASSATDESHLTTVLVEPSADSRRGTKSFDLYLASSVVGSWKNCAWNATVFRVVEPVFDSVGTIENSVVSVRNRATGKGDAYPVESSPVNECSDQMYFYSPDGPAEAVRGRLESLGSRDSFDIADYEFSTGSVDREVGQAIPRKTNRFTQSEFLKCYFRENAQLSSVFGDAENAPTDWYQCNLYLNEVYVDGGYAGMYVVLPEYVVLQYGDMVHYNMNICFSVYFDFANAASIDLSRSNFIF